MPKPPLSETIQLSYPGLLDGKEYGVKGGLQRFTIPDPSFQPKPFQHIPGPEIPTSDHPTLTFVRRPFSNVFVLEKK